MGTFDERAAQLSVDRRRSEERCTTLRASGGGGLALVRDAQGAGDPAVHTAEAIRSDLPDPSEALEPPARELSWPFGTLQRNHYGALLVDPPWAWSSWSKTRQLRAAERHYDVMSSAQILSLPVEDLAKPDCALFLWTINSMLPQAFTVIEAWGFTYKTVAFTWAKRTPTDKAWHIGLGYWSRQNTEQCLLATRGKPKRLSRSVRQLVIAPRRQHSRKPGLVRDSIVDLVGGPYAELFARDRRAGFDSWGFETDKFPAAA